MAIVELRTCDKYGVRKDVATYLIRVQKIDPENTIEVNETITEKTLDLCPRAVDVLVAAIERAVSPPKGRAK